MARPYALALFVALGLASDPARADVTEYFGDPGPEGGSTVILEAVSPAPPPAPAPVAVAEPAAVAEPEPAPEPEVVAETTSAAALPSEPICPEPVTFERVGDGSHERVSIALLGCDGRVDATSLTELSILARPSRVDRPDDETIEAHGGDADWVGPRVRRLHPGLVERLRQIANRFPGATIEIVSGYRPDARDGSRHRFGRALDFRVVGVPVADVDAFVQTIPQTGCGLYPTTDFIHVDVRTRSAHWIDTSGPGEAPEMVREPSPPVETPPVETPASSTDEEDDALDANDVAA